MTTAFKDRHCFYVMAIRPVCHFLWIQLLKQGLAWVAPRPCCFRLHALLCEILTRVPVGTPDRKRSEKSRPMAEAIRSDPLVPNSVRLGGVCLRTKIITGPNMGGKSSWVRMIALICIMAQVGSYVPADTAKLGIMDSVLTRMGCMIANASLKWRNGKICNKPGNLRTV